MSVINVNLEDSYKCKTIDRPLVVSVDIGDGQTGDVSVFLGTDLKDTPTLGVKADVVGKKTTIVATITGSLAETTWTSATISINEGGIITTFGPYKKQLPQNYDTVIYTLQIHLS